MGLYRQEQFDRPRRRPAPLGPDRHQNDGLVPGASEKGTWVRIFQPPVEGKLVGGYAGLQVGDRVHVQLVHTDVQQGFH